MRTRGFSLLETLMYIALFALIMEGSFTGMLAISELAERNQTKAYLEEEADFIITKVSYEISNATTVSLSGPDATNTEINLTTAEGGNVSIELSGSALVIARGNNVGVPFSSSNVRTSKVAFATDSKDSSSPIYFAFSLQTESASGKIVSEDFSAVSYPAL